MTRTFIFSLVLFSLVPLKANAQAAQTAQGSLQASPRESAHRPRREARSRFLLTAGLSLVVPTALTTAAIWRGAGCYELANGPPRDNGQIAMVTSGAILAAGLSILIAGIIRRARSPERVRVPLGKRILHGLLMGAATAGTVMLYSTPEWFGCNLS